MNKKMLRSYLLPFFFLCLLAVGFSACSHKINFASSSVVPAATGKVKVKRDKNSNYHIELDITNLAAPDKLDPPKPTYVVWIETDNNLVKNIGQLNSSSGFMSDALRAHLSTVTSFKPHRLFLTAEDNGTVLYPSPKTVLTTSAF